MHAASSPHRLGAGLKARLDAWVRRHLVDVDPHPEPSRLDRLDGLPAAGQDRDHDDQDRGLSDASQATPAQEMAS